MEVRNFANLGSVAASAALAMGHRSGDMTVIVRGTFSATVQVEISDDNTNWVIARDAAGAALSGITAARSVVVAGRAPYIRMNCTAYTSGSVVSRLITS